MPQILFNPDKVDMLKIAYKYHGNIAAIANHFDVSRDTIYEYFNRNHHGIDILKHIRKFNTEIHLDTAEYVIAYNMNNYKSNASLAQKAAEFMIDRKGHARGYKQKAEDEQANDQSVDQMKAILSQMQMMQEKNQNDLNNAESSNNPET